MGDGSDGWTLVQYAFDNGNFEELYAFFLEDHLFFRCGRSFNVSLFSFAVMNLDSLLIKIGAYVLEMLFYEFVYQLFTFIRVERRMSDASITVP